MPRLVPFRLAAACALALTLSLSVSLSIALGASGSGETASASAKGVPVELRVIGKGGKVLGERTVRAKTARVPTSPKAKCFGADSGGSGKPVTVKGPTALGALAQAADSTRSLRPLLVTDAFDFGLALCGVGGDVARTGSSTSWYFKVNHKSQSVGADQVRLKAGDEVLWALVVSEAPDYAYPDELALMAPGRVKAGTPFSVRVFSYDEKGKRRPAAGVKVSGAAQPTGKDGRTKLQLTKPRRLIARGDGGIPSNRVAICVGSKCPK